MFHYRKKSPVTNAVPFPLLKEWMSVKCKFCFKIILKDNWQVLPNVHWLFLCFTLDAFYNNTVVVWFEKCTNYISVIDNGMQEVKITTMLPFFKTAFKSCKVWFQSHHDAYTLNKHSPHLKRSGNLKALCGGRRHLWDWCRDHTISVFRQTAEGNYEIRNHELVVSRQNLSCFVKALT